MKVFNCDLHIHTCLSPCGDLDMYPANLVAVAVSRGIDLLAICDHNTAENVPHVIEAARGTSLSIIGGMEICSSEEVHLLGLFGDPDDLLSMQQLVYDHLAGANDEDLFGCQPVVNAEGVVEGFNPRLLIGATSLSLAELVDQIHARNGLAIASHIDRKVNSIIAQLGFIPPDLKLDALEVSFHGRSGFHCPASSVIYSSDAHFVEEIGRSTTRMELAEPTFAELVLAIGGQDGRRILNA